MINEYMFKPEEREMSSGARELLAVREAFNSHNSFFRAQKGSVIIWMTDSQVCHSFLTKGSRVQEIQEILLDIKCLEYEFDIKIYPKWTPREDVHLQLADTGSKMNISKEEYGVSHEDFINIQEVLGMRCTIDGFASSKSRRTYKFISICPQIESMDVDFFMHNMSSAEIYYCHPPVNCIKRVLSKLIQYTNVRILLVVPIWPSYSYWNSLIDTGYFNWFIKDYFIFRPWFVSFSERGMFRGYKPFPMLALNIATAETNQLKLPDFSKY